MPITLVCGPPCSGKSRYVDERFEPGDLVWDYDVVARALTWSEQRRPEWILPFACEARDAILERLARPSHLRHAWIIAFGATRAERAAFRSHQVVILDVDADTCKQRAAWDNRPYETYEQIDKWWSLYEREW